MIVCPNCNHQNPEDSIQCENCYTPLPSTSPCPNCGAAVQTDATFCGQCGFNLQVEQDKVTDNPFSVIEEDTDNSTLDNTIPTAVTNTPIVSPWDQDTNDMTLEQAMSVDETEIMNESQSETPWEIETGKTGAMPWENLDLESSSELPELSQVNISELEIPEIPELNLELPDEGSDRIPELPELNLELPDEGSDRIPELPELNLELPDEGSDRIPELPELNLDSSEEDIQTSEFSEMDLDSSEENIQTSEFSEMDLASSEEDIQTSEFSEMDLASSEEDIQTSEFSEMDLASSEENIQTSEFSEMDLASSEENIQTSEVDEISSDTQLQIQQASLFHVQTSTTIEIAQDLDVIHIGKPNSQIPPDVDTSGFPNSDIVSRIHADIRVEGDTYFIEDVGSSNGTYINHIPLSKGNRYRLRTGDRIALGKGDLVTFIFQIR